jgi:hypothetical protein
MRKRVAAAGLRVLVLGLIAAAAAACDVTMGAPEFSVREEKTFTVTGPAQISLQTWDGSIEVRGWDKNEVRIEVEKRGPDQATVDRITVKATQAGNVITVEVAKPSPLTTSGFRSSPAANLVVSAPLKTTLTARSGDGSIKVRRVTGKVDLDTDDGSVSLDEIAGDVVVRTGDGSINGSDITGRVALKTSDGSIELSGVLAGLTIDTHDGSVDLTARRGSRADDAWEVTTGDGSVTLALPADFAADLDAHTGDGRVQVEQIDEKAGAADQKDDAERSTVRAKLGPGGKALRLRTGSGRITVKVL